MERKLAGWHYTPPFGLLTNGDKVEYRLKVEGDSIDKKAQELKEI